MFKTANIGGDRITDNDSPSTKCQRPTLRTDERVKVRASSSLWDGKLSLKAEELQVGQR